MTDFANRFDENPLLCPSDVKPSCDGFIVECVCNPGVFTFESKIYLVLRVAERPVQEKGFVSTIIMDTASENGFKIIRVKKTDPDLIYDDPRVFTYKDQLYLTTFSHLRLASSENGVDFCVDENPLPLCNGDYDTYGKEDCRVTYLEGKYYLTYSSLSSIAVGVGLSSTSNWREFACHGLIFLPDNKECAIFPQKIGGYYYCLSRPRGIEIGGNYIWISRSPDLVHWGGYYCVATTRPNKWDSFRVGVGGVPILTSKGWLEIYHGGGTDGRYYLGALLLDRNEPTKVLGRSEKPIMEPITDYETCGFVKGGIIYTDGYIANGDEIVMYYGASDEVVGGAKFSIGEILDSIS